MEIEFLKLEGKLGKLYFSHCPNCNKYIIIGKGNTETIVCSNCRRKFRIEFSEEVD